jgi:hypothetical protein
MEVLVKDVPFPPTFPHLLVFTHPDINKVKLDNTHTPPRYLVYGKPYAVNRALTGRVLMQVYASILDLIRFYLAGKGQMSTIEKSEVVPIHMSRQLDVVIEQIDSRRRWPSYMLHPWELTMFHLLWPFPLLLTLSHTTLMKTRSLLLTTLIFHSPQSKR